MAIEQVDKPVQITRRYWCGPQLARCFTVSGAVFSALCVLAVSGAGPAGAQTLHRALAKAYRMSPRLEAARARLRATDEDVPQALAGWRPVITGSSDFGYESTKTKPRTTSSGRFNSFGYSLNLKQNLFDGFQTTNRVRGAEAGIRAERELLRQTEQEVLLRGVTVYMDVIRDQGALALAKSNVHVLTRALRAARARRAEREITRTDVAQSRARRAQAVSDLEEARAKLKASRAGFRRVIGARARALRAPSYRSRLIPRSLRASLELARNDHPLIVAAKFKEQAERYHVDRVRGELLPEVNLEAHYGKRFDGSPSISVQEDARITGRITVPFYRGGQVHSRVRQAKHRHVARLQEIEQARLEVEDIVRSAWSTLRAARARLRSGKVQVRSAGIALEGVREEEKVGQRTIIELLNAQQEFVRAKVERTRIRHNLVVAAYTMIAAVGRLSAERLAVTPEIYDPKEHYYDVRNKRFGTSIIDDEGDDDDDTSDNVGGREGWRYDDDVLNVEPYKLGRPASTTGTLRRKKSQRAMRGAKTPPQHRLQKRPRQRDDKRLQATARKAVSGQLRRPRDANKMRGQDRLRQANARTPRAKANHDFADEAFNEVSSDLYQMSQQAGLFASVTTQRPVGAVAGRTANVGGRSKGQRGNARRRTIAHVPDKEHGLSALINEAAQIAAGQAPLAVNTRIGDGTTAPAGVAAGNVANVSRAMPTVVEAVTPMRPFTPRASGLTAGQTSRQQFRRPAAHPIVAGSNSAGAAQARYPTGVAAPARPPLGFRGALGAENGKATARAAFRPAADLSLVNANRRIAIIRGARTD